MTKKDILDYVMNTPHNTNRAVLSGMLNQLTDGDGGVLKNKTLSITIINNSGHDLSQGMPLQIIKNDSGLIKYVFETMPIEDETIDVTSLIVPRPDGSASFGIELPIFTQGTLSISVSNDINCTLSSEFMGYSIIVTDITKDASVTLTVTFSQSTTEPDPGTY